MEECDITDTKRHYGHSFARSDVEFDNIVGSVFVDSENDELGYLG